MHEMIRQALSLLPSDRFLPLLTRGGPQYVILSMLVVRCFVKYLVNAADRAGAEPWQDKTLYMSYIDLFMGMAWGQGVRCCVCERAVCAHMPLCVSAFLILSVLVVRCFVKYLINATDRAGAEPWQDKTLYMSYIDLFMGIAWGQ